MRLVDLTRERDGVYVEYDDGLVLITDRVLFADDVVALTITRRTTHRATWDRLGDAGLSRGIVHLSVVGDTCMDTTRGFRVYEVDIVRSRDAERVGTGEARPRGAVILRFPESAIVRRVA